MMNNIKVKYEGYRGDVESRVFAVDPKQKTFLIVDRRGYFMWVPCEQCKILEE